MTSKLSKLRNDTINRFYLQSYFSKLGTVLPKLCSGTFYYDSRLDVREVSANSVRALSRYFAVRFLFLEIGQKLDNLDVRP